MDRDRGHSPDHSETLPDAPPERDPRFARPELNHKIQWEIQKISSRVLREAEIAFGSVYGAEFRKNPAFVLLRKTVLDTVNDAKREIQDLLSTYDVCPVANLEQIQFRLGDPQGMVMEMPAGDDVLHDAGSENTSPQRAEGMGDPS